MEQVSYNHPTGRYCGDQMCCWGQAMKKVPKGSDSQPRKVFLGTVHIAREGYGSQAALCGVKNFLVHGGPATCDCKRCLTSKAGRDWIKSTTNPLGRRLVQHNLKRLGLKWPK